MICPQCRADVPARARFCPSCGHELVVVGDQRRIATVLFADLVGFTSLSETLDPEQVKGLVDRCFDRLAADIEAFGGRVDKVVGDAIVALFGAPVAHEDDAERAVRAGLRMQETLSAMSSDTGRNVRMRVGINTGEVLVGSVRAGREYTAMGDVVNTASRLQEAAAPGTVLVGPETHAATRDVVEYDDIDPVEAKGKRLPVKAWVAVRALAPPGHRQRRTRAPLVGRETELSLLNNIAATGVDRCRASLLMIHGEAGMGKSRLAAETAEYATNQLDALVLEGRCVPYGEANVWWPIAEAVRTAAGLDPSVSEVEADAALRRAAADSLEESGRSDELDRVVSGLHHLLGYDGLRGIDATRARDEAIRSVVALIEGYTHRQPVFLVLSDVHWAEQEVLDLVDTLLGRLARRRFVVLATARRALHERWVPSPEAANTVVLHLDPLDEEASHRLLRQLSDDSLHPAMAAMLVDRAGGNPFYLEELVSLIQEAGVHTVDQLLDTEAGELPTTLRGLVAARLDALVPVDRQILDDATVLGRRGRLGALITMVEVKRGLDREVVRSHLERLAAREFLVLDGDTYSFRSDVIREVAYSTLTKADRARAHAGIARWIEDHEDPHKTSVVDQIASHYAAAAELVADIGHVGGVPDDVHRRALDWLRAAWVQADSDSLPATVVALATRALELADSDALRQDILLRRAQACVETYDLDGAIADTEEARALATVRGDDAALASGFLVLGEALRHRGAYGEALELFVDARRLFNALGDIAQQAEAERLRGMVLMFTGDFTAADEAYRSALASFQQVDDRRGVAWVLQNLSWSAYIAGRVDEAEQRVDAAMATFEELGDPVGLTWTRGLLAWVRFHQGRDDEAEALADEVGEDARERGEVWGEAMMVVLTSAIALWNGRTDEAIDRGRRAVDLFAEIDDHTGELQARCGLGRALIMAGRIDAGLDELAYAVESASTGGGEQEGLPRIATLSAAVQLGDIALGESMVVGHLSPEVRDSVAGTDEVAALALHHLQCGRPEAARAAVSAASGDARGYLGCTQALVAAVAGEHGEALHLADQVPNQPHTYLDRTYAEIARALVHAATGDVLTGRADLAGVLGVVDRTGDQLAQALVRLTDATLAEHGDTVDAATVRAGAEERLRALGIEADGWRQLLRSALEHVTAG